MPENKLSFLWKTRKFELCAGIVLLAVLALMLTSSGADIFSKNGSTLESRLEHILLAIDGADNIETMITQTESGEITGIVVVACGVDNIGTYLSIQNAVRTLLNIDLSQIHIIVQP